MWTEPQRAELAQVTEADRQAAMIAARRYMEPRYRAMLNTDEDSDWEYAVALGLFLYRGRAVRSAVARRQLDRVLAGIEGETKALADNRDVPAWALAMTGVVKTSALVGASFAAGGWSMIDPYARDTEAWIANELGYLDNFADELQSGAAPRDGRYTRRAMLYATAGWGFYNLVQGIWARILGNQEERSVLDPGAEHCQQCVDEADKDWQPIGTLVPIGDRQCLTHCRCYMEYRVSPA